MPAKKIINQKDLAELISQNKNLSLNRNQIEEIIKLLNKEITKQLRSGGSIRMTGFGTFSPKNRHARFGVNPQNPKEKIKMSQVTVAKFKAGKNLKDALKK